MNSNMKAYHCSIIFNPNIEVLVKEYPKKFLMNYRTLEKTIREFYKVDSPYAEQLLYFHQTSTHYYIVTNFYMGENLFNILETRNMEEKEGMFLFFKICLLVNFYNVNHIYFPHMRLDHIYVKDIYSLKYINFSYFEEEQVYFRFKKDYKINPTFLLQNQMSSLGKLLYYIIFGLRPKHMTIESEVQKHNFSTRFTLDSLERENVKEKEHLISEKPNINTFNINISKPSTNLHSFVKQPFYVDQSYQVNEFKLKDYSHHSKYFLIKLIKEKSFPDLTQLLKSKMWYPFIYTTKIPDEVQFDIKRNFAHFKKSNHFLRAIKFSILLYLPYTVSHIETLDKLYILNVRPDADTINYLEFKQMMQELGCSDKESREMFDILDVNKNDSLSYSEFILGFCTFDYPNVYRVAQFIFKSIDVGGDEELSLEDMLKFFDNCNYVINQMELINIFKELDQNMNDSIDFAEFNKMYKTLFTQVDIDW